MAAGCILLVALISFASSHVIPVQPIAKNGIGNNNNENTLENPLFNGNVNPVRDHGAPSNLNPHIGVNYRNKHNGSPILDASLTNRLHSVPGNDQERVDLAIGHNSMAASDIFRNVLGFRMPVVTGGTAVAATPEIKASTLQMATTTTAPLKSPTTSMSWEDYTPYPFITGIYFTTGAPDYAVITPHH